MKIIHLTLIVAALVVAGGCGGEANTNANTNRNANTNVTASTPVSANTDPALKANIENALRQKGFNNVTVDVTTTPATLRGTYPKGKLAEVIQTAQAANNMKPLQNQMSEEN